MNKEYDFTKGEKGKFYYPNEEFSYPIYLDQSVQKHFFELAREQQKTPSDLINETLKKVIAS